MANKYRVTFKSVGNPDFNQYAHVSEPETFEAARLAEISTAACRYIERWGLGGGNWTDPYIYLDGRRIGYVSYNGRLWKGSPRDINGKELHEVREAGFINDRRALLEALEKADAAFEFIEHVLTFENAACADEARAAIQAVIAKAKREVRP